MSTMECLICSSKLIENKATEMMECPECGILYETENSKIEIKPSKALKLSSLVRRARMMCEDGEFKNAKETIDRALDENPEDAEAYFVGLMIDLHCRKEEELDGLWIPNLAENKNFERAKKFGNRKMKSKLSEFEECALEPISERVCFTISDTAAIRLACEKMNLMTKISLIAEKKAHKDLMKIDPCQRVNEDALENYEDSLEAEEAECKKKLDSIERGTTREIEESLQDSIRPITWRILRFDESEKHALIIADENVAKAPFHLLPENVSWDPIYKSWRKAELYEALWENCSLRKWLNEDFYESLPSELRNLIVQTRIDNPGNGTIPAQNTTRDKVFLLSIVEAEDLFPTDASRKSGNPWWLRTQGRKIYDGDKPTTTAVSWSGDIDYDGRSVSPTCSGFTHGFDNAEGIRPCMWIRVKK